MGAGNASGICDGAAANVVVSEEAVKRYGLKPLAKVVAYHVNAVEPTVMGIGPVEGIRGVLKKAGLKMEDIDLFDINEAFAAQWLAVQKELGLPMEKSNVNGGAIALGRPHHQQPRAHPAPPQQAVRRRFGVHRWWPGVLDRPGACLSAYGLWVE